MLQPVIHLEICSSELAQPKSASPSDKGVIIPIQHFSSLFVVIIIIIIIIIITTTTTTIITTTIITTLFKCLVGDTVNK